MDGVEAWSCSGTPVDCVKLAIYKLLGGNKPDLLVSGVNHGANISINVLYSGTMSAAVEGAMEDIPSIGFSLMDHAIEADFSQVRPVIRTVVGNALERRLDTRHLFECERTEANGDAVERLAGLPPSQGELGG